VKFIPAIQNIVPYVPGAPIETVMRRYGLEHVVKLASNEFPQPPFPEVKEAIVAALDGLNRYPDGDAFDLRSALSERYQRPLEEIAVGNGTCEMLLHLGDALLERGDEVVFADPSFIVYKDLCDLREARAVAVPVLPDFGHDLEAMAAAIGPRTKMVILCSPNNPTGNYLPAAEVAGFVDRIPEDVLVVLDEAYNECVAAPDWQDTLRLQAERPNVCILRTFSKVYGLAGLRIGYGLCPPPLKSALDKVRQPFHTNTLAQVAAIEALKHQDRVLERRRQNAEVREYLRDALAAMGRSSIPTEANFMLVDITDLCDPQEQVCASLMALGAIVRDGNALGCPGWARVTVGTPEEIDFFLARLRSLELPASS
jgi:histidinol-phosphate aminotransferase